MPERRPRPRAVPAVLDAHRVTAGPASRPPARPAAPAPPVVTTTPLASPVRSAAPASDAARVARTVDALRRLQVTLAGAEAALEAVVREMRRDAASGPAPVQAPTR